MPADPNEYFAHEFLERGIFRADEIAAGCHCMTPAYLADQWIAAAGIWASKAWTFSICTIPRPS